MSKKIGILLVLCLVAGFGCEQKIELQPVNETKPTAQQVTTDPKIVEAKKVLDSEMKKIASTDADFDGLSNDEEKTFGTNAESTDTDDDGLTDYDEVKIRKTDPKKADTDGDGKTDGYEAGRGLDPLKK